MKIEKNVEIPKEIKKCVRKSNHILQVLKDFVNGTDENVCITFDSEEELNREYRNLMTYCNRHEINVRFVKENSRNRLYIIRKALPCTPREDGALTGIITRHGNDDYGLWEGFALTKEEEMDIWAILMCHDTEGCSVRGTRKQIAKEMEE